VAGRARARVRLVVFGGCLIYCLVGLMAFLVGVVSIWGFYLGTGQRAPGNLLGSKESVLRMQNISKSFHNGFYEGISSIRIKLNVDFGRHFIG